MASTWPCPAASRGSTSITFPRAGHAQGPATAALATGNAFVQAAARPHLLWHTGPRSSWSTALCRPVLRWRRASRRCDAQRSGNGAFDCRAPFAQMRGMAPLDLRASVQKTDTARGPAGNQRMPVAYSEASTQSCVRMECVRTAPGAWNPFGTAWERLRNALGTAAQHTAAGPRSIGCHCARHLPAHARHAHRGGDA